MKIKRNTPDIFVAEEVPWLIAIMRILFIFAFVAPGVGMAFDGFWQGLLFALAGGGMGFAARCVFVERLQVILDRRSGLITLRRRTVLKYDQQKVPLDAFVRAKRKRRQAGKTDAPGSSIAPPWCSPTKGVRRAILSLRSIPAVAMRTGW